MADARFFSYSFAKRQWQQQHGRLFQFFFSPISTPYDSGEIPLDWSSRRKSAQFSGRLRINKSPCAFAD
jgi:hypothetical protein